MKQTRILAIDREDCVSKKAFSDTRLKSFTSPDYLRQIREARNYELIFQRNGTFHADDVPPGTYEMRIKVTKPKAPARSSVVEHPDELGALVQEVVVPPGNQPYDLGAILVPVRNE